MVTFKTWTTRKWVKDKNGGGHFERQMASGYFLFGVLPLWIERE